MQLRVDDICASQAFVFLWVGSEEGLEHGRRCFNRWGFRRSEDIVWLKTNKSGQPSPASTNTKSALIHTKEHCLIGMRGKSLSLKKIGLVLTLSRRRSDSSKLGRQHHPYQLRRRCDRQRRPWSKQYGRSVPFLPIAEWSN